VAASLSAPPGTFVRVRRTRLAAGRVLAAALSATSSPSTVVLPSAPPPGSRSLIEAAAVLAIADALIARVS
jgi:hypothetical protein